MGPCWADLSILSFRGGTGWREEETVGLVDGDGDRASLLLLIRA